MDVRPAATSEIAALAKIWYEGWQDAHADIVPPDLLPLRTLQSFQERLEAALPRVRAAGPLGEPSAFYMLKHDELDQFYVSAAARGTGIAAKLLADAELELSKSGVEQAWLACAIGNVRAARFYEKCGWRRVGNMVHRAETASGLFPLETWRYEKTLTRPA